MREITWPTVDGPVNVLLDEDEWKWWQHRGKKLIALPPGPERTLLLNEIRTIMDIKALLDATRVVMPTAPTLPRPDDNRIGKFAAPDHGAPVTQRQAAILVYPATGTQRRDVLDCIAGSGERGCTDEEVQQKLAMRVQTETPRRNELVDDGWIEDSGRTRPTTSGREATVWVLTASGRSQLRGELAA